MRKVKPERLGLYECVIVLEARDSEAEKLITGLMEELKKCGDRYELRKKDDRLSLFPRYTLRDKRMRIYCISSGIMFAPVDSRGKVNPNKIIYLCEADFLDTFEYMLGSMKSFLSSMNCLTAVEMLDSLFKQHKEFKVGVWEEWIR